MRAARQSCNFLEGRAGAGIVAFLKQECGNAQKRKFTGPRANIVHAFFHGIADIDERIDFLDFRLSPCRRKNAAKLGHAALAGDFAHQMRKLIGVRDPA